MHLIVRNVLLPFGGMADVNSMPKIKIVEKDLGPISLTLCVFNSAEKFVVSSCTKGDRSEPI